MTSESRPEDLPVGWIDSATLPHDRYRVFEEEDGWHVYTFDPATAYFATHPDGGTVDR